MALGYVASRIVEGAAILVGFRRGVFMEMAGPGWPMFDKSAYPPRQLGLSDAVRLVPGGSAVRRGAYVASYDGTFIDGAAGGVTTNLEDLNRALALTPTTSNLLVFSGM